MWDASATLIMETRRVSETSDFGLSLTKAITAEDLVHFILQITLAEYAFRSC